MAKASCTLTNQFTVMLDEINYMYPEVATAALKAGADVIADEMKSILKKQLSPFATGALVKNFGITPVKQSLDDDYNVHIGFDGYQPTPWGMWKAKGVPYQLLARVINSGAIKDGKIWRHPKPFAEPAVMVKKRAAQEAMRKAAEEELSRIIRKNNV